MNLWESMRVAPHGSRREAKVRSALTMLRVIIGVAAVIDDECAPGARAAIKRIRRWAPTA